MYSHILINQTQLKIFRIFAIGFIMYTVSITLYGVSAITFRTSAIIEGTGMILFIFSSIFLIRLRFENKYLRFFFLIYLLWLGFVISRGFEFSTSYLSVTLFDDYAGIFIYLSPLILLFPQNIILYRKTFLVVIVLGIFHLLLSAFFIRNLLNRDLSNGVSLLMVESFARHFALPCTFLVLTYSYQTKKIKLFALLVTFLTILFAIIRARRGMLLTLFTPLLFAGTIYFIESKKKVVIVFLSIAAAMFLVFYALIFFKESRFFSSFRSRIDEDTRTGVENCFYKDMNSMDWVIGKGIDGQYYCGLDPNNKTHHRTIIETDYLNIVLKGGLVSLSLFLLITLPAAIKGIFYSSNNLSKASGYWILIWLINLYPTTVVSFNLNYLLLWVCVGICYNKNIRDIPESLMKVYFTSLQPIANDR